jgi:hypothetical protein
VVFAGFPPPSGECRAASSRNLECNQSSELSLKRLWPRTGYRNVKFCFIVIRVYPCYVSFVVVFYVNCYFPVINIVELERGGKSFNRNWWQRVAWDQQP